MMANKTTIFILQIILCFIAANANAAIVSRFGGLGFYDTESDLTWYTYGQYAGTKMTWDQANTWAGNLYLADTFGWRLPTSDLCVGFCLDSEMGNLYFNVFGADAGVGNLPTYDYHFQPGAYWLSTENENYTNNAWYFVITEGYQGSDAPKSAELYVLAVHDGDVAALSSVPVPAAIWFFGSGLIILIGVAKRKVA